MSETAAQTKARHLQQLEQAYTRGTRAGLWVVFEADLMYRVIRASVKAALPGRQNAKNVEPALAKAVAAGCRVIRANR